MILDTKGRCKCATGFDFNSAKTECVPDTTPETENDDDN